MDSLFEAGWIPVAVAAAGAVAVAGIGGLLTEIGPWYRALRKPSWQPREWLFGPAWTLIFALAVWAAVLAWNAAPNDDARSLIVALFVLNGAFNIGWSGLFFKLRRPDWALVEVFGLWLSVAALIATIGGSVPVAGWLLAPYLAWVTFAAILNRVIVQLNEPFAIRVPA